MKYHQENKQQRQTASRPWGRLASRRCWSRQAFTLIELLVVIAIISLLVSILLPSLSRAKELARGTVCLSNMRSTGLAVQMYANQNNEFYPASSCGLSGSAQDTFWINALQPYSGTRLLYRCPSDPTETFLDWNNPPPAAQWNDYRWASYSTNGCFKQEPHDRLNGIPRPVETIYACETPESVLGADHVHPEMWWTGIDAGNQVAHGRHLGKANYLFADGHADQMALPETWEQNKRNLWNPKKTPVWSTPFEY